MDTFNKVLSTLETAGATGEKTLKNRVKLIGNISQVGPEAYFHIIFPELNNAEIAKIENTLGTELPVQYVEFLRKANGAILFGGNFSLYGLRTSFVREGEESYQPFSIETPNIKERPKDALSDWIIIGGYRQDGSRLYIDKNSGMVYRSERTRASHQLNSWKDFWSMLDAEVDRMSKLFDVSNQIIGSEDDLVPTRV